MSGATSAILAATAISGAGTTTTDSFSVLNADGYAMQGTATGTLAGTFKVQGSTNDVAYADIDGLSATLDGATATPVLLEDDHMGYAYVRAVFVYASGSGNLAVTASVQHKD